MILHCEEYFNWNEKDNPLGTNAGLMFLPAQFRGDTVSSNSGGYTYGLPAWYFIAHAREYSVLSNLYEEIKPIKQYVTVKVVGFASNVAKITGSGESTATEPRTG